MNTPTNNENPSDKITKFWRYQVTATLRGAWETEQYLRWLSDGHVAAVCHWATDAEIVHMHAPETNEPTHHVMSVYWFEGHDAFKTYEREGAPTLREEGIAFAQTLGGIEFTRSVGWSWRASAPFD